MDIESIRTILHPATESALPKVNVQLEMILDGEQHTNGAKEAVKI